MGLGEGRQAAVESVESSENDSLEAANEKSLPDLQRFICWVSAKLLEEVKNAWGNEGGTRSSVNAEWRVHAVATFVNNWRGKRNENRTRTNEKSKVDLQGFTQGRRRLKKASLPRVWIGSARLIIILS